MFVADKNLREGATAPRPFDHFGLFLRIHSGVDFIEIDVLGFQQGDSARAVRTELARIDCDISH